MVVGQQTNYNGGKKMKEQSIKQKDIKDQKETDIHA